MLPIRAAVLYTALLFGANPAAADIAAADALRAGDMQPKPAMKKPASPLFAADLKRFPPVEDVVAVLDRTARRAFVA